MHFPYESFPVPTPVVSLGGRTARPKPVVPTTLIGPTGSHFDRCFLDTGADDTVFPEYLAAKLGIDLTNAPARSATGVGMTPYLIRYAEVILRVTDGTEFREWPAWVGFTPAALRRPLLGFAGCLQFFTAAFDGEREQVTLAVTARYPGG